jgi:hypothetical protein
MDEKNVKQLAASKRHQAINNAYVNIVIDADLILNSRPYLTRISLIDSMRSC